MQAIDRAIKFWQGRRVHRRVPLRAPWLLTPDWRKLFRQHLTTHTKMMQPLRLTSPSTSLVFTKYPSVADSLCNHKEAAHQWAEEETPQCICQHLTPYTAWMNANEFTHVVLDGETMQLPETPPSLRSVATRSLQNKSSHRRKRSYPFYEKDWTYGRTRMDFHL